MEAGAVGSSSGHFKTLNNDENNLRLTFYILDRRRLRTDVIALHLIIILKRHIITMNPSQILNYKLTNLFKYITFSMYQENLERPIIFLSGTT